MSENCTGICTRHSRLLHTVCIAQRDTSGGAAALQLKAGEAGTLLSFAVELCRRYSDHIRESGPLLEAGIALEDYVRLLVEAPACVPRATCKTLMDLCLRHL